MGESEMKKNVKTIYNEIVFHKGQLITWADEKNSPNDMEVIKRMVKGNIFIITDISRPKIPELIGHKQMLSFVCKNNKDNGYIYSGAYFKPYVECEEVKVAA